jgi:hypothetical protein
MTKATRETWAGRVAKWRASGLTAREFGEREGLNAATLRWWASQLKREPHHEAAFVEVTLKSAATSSLELIVRDGLRIQLTRGFDAELLRDVLTVLEAR